MATRDYEPFPVVRSCCCVGYLTNPGGRCCMDFAHGIATTTDKIVIGPGPVAQGWQCPFCKTVYGPQEKSCDCQKRNMVMSGTSTTTLDPRIVI